MKKLMLDLQRLTVKDDLILNRKQLREITGGEICYSVGQSCSTDEDCCGGLICDGLNFVCVESGDCECGCKNHSECGMFVCSDGVYWSNCGVPGRDCYIHQCVPR